MSSYKLYYFKGRGRAEVTRLIFAAAGQKFEDIRYDQGEWSKRKTQMPLGQMPVLEHNGVKLPQSMAIARFLAKEFHLAGRDNFEQAKVDAVVDTIHDGVSKFSPLRWIKDATKKQDRLKKFLAEDLPTNLQHLEVLGKLYGNGGSFFVANRLSWADLYFYDSTENFLEADKNILGNYPWLKHNRQEVEKQPKMSTYLRSRPRTVF